MTDEIALLRKSDELAESYLKSIPGRDVFPSVEAISALSAFDEPLPEQSLGADETLAWLSEMGTPATVTSNGPRYFGFVIGALLPAAAAAERLALAWDQCGSSYTNSPLAAKLESVAGRWLLEVLDLPRESAVAFGTSATACGLSCLAAARRELLRRLGWDLDKKGLRSAPEIKVLAPDTLHITVKKALRILGFGEEQLIFCPTDSFGRLDADQLPVLDDKSILCLQAGEVNTGEFDLFEDLIPKAKSAGAWVHVDGAFGLWARASQTHRHLSQSVDLADSWTTDGHKCLNTPYDSAVAICRRPEHLYSVMNADAPYAKADVDAQKNLTLEFSRRARGIAIWAALRSLGRAGVSDLIDQYCRQAKTLGRALEEMGLQVLNRVVFNQVLGRASSEEKTLRFLQEAQQSGKLWFGPSVWQNQAAFRLSVCSWRTTDEDIAKVTKILRELPVMRS